MPDEIMRSKVLAVAFNPSLDKTVSLERLQLGGEWRALESRTVAGGKAINVARMLQVLGVQVRIWGVAGGASGRMMTELLAADQPDQEWVWIDGETRINLTILERSSGRTTRVLEPGPHWGKPFRKKALAALLLMMKDFNAVVFSGSLPPGMPPDELAALIRQARTANVLTALDTSGPALARGMRARPFLVKPNREEAEELCGFRIRSRKDVKKALDYLSGWSNMSLISLGPEGLAACDTARMFWARGPVLSGESTVGCGDVLLAGFLESFLQGRPLEECLQRAVACGTANIGAVRPGAVSLRRMKEVLSKIKVERL